MVQNFCNLTVNFLQIGSQIILTFDPNGEAQSSITYSYLLLTDKIASEMKNYFVAAASEGFLYSDLIEGL